MILRHAALLIQYKGEHTAILEMRKHVGWYTAGWPGSSKLRERVNRMETMEELRALFGHALFGHALFEACTL